MYKPKLKAKQRTMCRNCKHCSYSVDRSNEPGDKQIGHWCANADSKYYGISVYPWDTCPDYEKRYHRNRQLDITDAIEVTRKSLHENDI